MKATVQYNDIIGTVAADVSDFYKNSLQYYLSNHFSGFDANRYFCVGCTITGGGQMETPSASLSFICKDRIDNKYVKLCPMVDMTLDEIFSLFKRFDIVIGQNIQDVNVRDEDYLDLK